MNRLTVKNESGAWDVPIRTSDDVAAFIPSQEIIDRLAAYEDTGLEPEEVRSMKWIPVTERLPETCTFVLACFDDVQVIAFYGNYQWQEAFSNQVFYPTHWMPLPEPPEGGSDG